MEVMQILFFVCTLINVCNLGFQIGFEKGFKKGRGE